jgi:SpoIID/LytB domain protein
MKPPQIKVALLWGKSRFRLHSRSPLSITAADEKTHRLSAGETEFTLINVSPTRRRRWLWIGNSREEDVAKRLAPMLRGGGITTALLPVGLTPESNRWKARRHRILIRPEDGDWEKFRHHLQEIQPADAGTFVEIPEGMSQGVVCIHCADGSQLELMPPLELQSEDDLDLLDAPVGEGFHWQHTETLTLSSPFWIAIGSDGGLCAGVRLDVEDYLASVNSSEMPADSPLEFLKAQVVAARSWLLANWGSHHPGEPYTVCGGDHCQCYYGTARIAASSREAAEATAGQVLMHDGSICDARYAKSCGGVTEPAANVWAHTDEPYLGHFRDLPAGAAPDLSDEERFRGFQRRRVAADACCSPGFAPLTGKLDELSRLYRWDEIISEEGLRNNIRHKTGLELGRIEALIPLRRGPSGRLIEMEIAGTDGRLRVAPELIIRRALSPTHLPSSAFWVERAANGDFIFHGLGWGHGVGMCQIGAAALAVQGLRYARILEHYYPNTSLEKIY